MVALGLPWPRPASRPVSGLTFSMAYATLVPSETGPVAGRVRQLLKHFATASFTTEYCDIDLTDETPDAERVDPQMAAIRGMFR